jgi:hypothetical protein
MENNNRIDLREIGREGVERIHLAQDRDKSRALVKTGIEPSSSIKGEKVLD